MVVGSAQEIGEETADLSEKYECHRHSKHGEYYQREPSHFAHRRDMPIALIRLPHVRTVLTKIFLPIVVRAVKQKSTPLKVLVARISWRKTA